MAVEEDIARARVKTSTQSTTVHLVEDEERGTWFGSHRWGDEFDHEPAPSAIEAWTRRWETGTVMEGDICDRRRGYAPTERIIHTISQKGILEA